MASDYKGGMGKPPFRNEACRMPTTVGSGPGGSGSALPPKSGPTRMPTTVSAGPGGEGGSALPPHAGPTRMNKGA